MYEVRDFTLSELLRKSTAHYADRPALGMVGESPLSYADLDRASARAAARFRAWGITVGDRIAILAENSPAWGVAYFGAIRAGAVLVPILTDFTPEQVANIVRHSGAVLALGSPKTFQKLTDPAGSCIASLRAVLDIRSLAPVSLAEGWNAPAEASIIESARLADAQVHRDDPAMIVYTSGTTGLSKGVVLSHGNIVSNADSCKSIIVLRRTDRLLSILPLAHTYEFTIGFVIPMMMGSWVQYLDRPPSASVLLPALKAVRPTIMLSVPLVIEKIYFASIKPTLESMHAYRNPILRPLLERFAGAKLMRTFGGKLRFFGVGGAALGAETEAFLKKAGFPYAIGYGLTECAPLLAGSPPSRTHLRSTGPALHGVSIRIADPRPDTGEGEIQARGPNIFKGYYLDPARTAEAFTADGWFRTGDLGLIDDKGRVFVRGRIKTMILGSSGENIYPEEIEAILNGSPYVAESLVYGDEEGLTALVYLKSEVLENLQARLKDGIESAEGAATRIGQAVAGAERAAAGKIGHAVADAEKVASGILEKIRKETNDRLAVYSRIHQVRIQHEPFEKTPTQKIKRFLYPKKDGP